MFVLAYKVMNGLLDVFEALQFAHMEPVANYSGSTLTSGAMVCHRPAAIVVVEPLLVIVAFIDLN